MLDERQSKLETTTKLAKNGRFMRPSVAQPWTVDKPPGGASVPPLAEGDGLRFAMGTLMGLKFRACTLFELGPEGLVGIRIFKGRTHLRSGEGVEEVLKGHGYIYWKEGRLGKLKLVQVGRGGRVCGDFSGSQRDFRPAFRLWKDAVFEHWSGIDDEPFRVVQSEEALAFGRALGKGRRFGSWLSTPQAPRVLRLRSG